VPDQRNTIDSFTYLDGLLILSAAVPFLYLVFHFNFLSDDSFISFRYSENLVNGYGFRYNLHENPPIEGFSSPLWVLVIALLKIIRIEPELASRAISITSGLALLGLVYFAAGRVMRLDRMKSFIGALSLGLFPPFFIWSTSGMETLPFSLCIFALLVTFLTPQGRFMFSRAAVLGLILILIRPEGVIYAAAVPVIVGVYFRKTKRKLCERKTFLGYFLILASGLAAVTVFRLIYFHYAFPNTFYVKVGMQMSQLQRGLFYVLHFFLTFSGASIIIIAALAAMFNRIKNEDVFPPAALAGLMILLNIAMGGDYMCMARFFVPMAALLSLVLAGALCPSREELVRMLSGAFKRFERRTAHVFILLVLTVGAVVLNLLPAFDYHAAPLSLRKAVNFRWGPQGYVTERKAWEAEKYKNELWTLCGKVLAWMTTPNESAVLGAIGAVGYYSHLQIYDRYGLISAEVSHNKVPRLKTAAGHDKRVPIFYFLEHKPDIIAPRLMFMETAYVAIEKYDRQLSELPEEQSILYSSFAKPVIERFQGREMALVGIKRVDYEFIH